MEKAQTYYLDLQTLVPYLRDRSAILHSSVTLPKSREASLGSLFIRQGKIAGCFLHSATGLLLLSGEEAYKTLLSNKKWEVQIETEFGVLQAMAEITGAATPRVAPRQQASQPLFPPKPTLRRVHMLDEAVLANLSPQQRFIVRTVFTLVNGERTVEQIQSMLNLSPRNVEEALAYLRDHYIIE